MVMKAEGPVSAKNVLLNQCATLANLGPNTAQIAQRIWVFWV